MLYINDLITINPNQTRERDLEVERLISTASDEDLLQFKIELITTLGMIEIHSSPSNSVAVWYAQKLAGLLTIVEDDMNYRVKEWKH